MISSSAVLEMVHISGFMAVMHFMLFTTGHYMIIVKVKSLQSTLQNPKWTNYKGRSLITNLPVPIVAMYF